MDGDFYIFAGKRLRGPEHLPTLSGEKCFFVHTRKTRHRTRPLVMALVEYIHSPDETFVDDASGASAGGHAIIVDEVTEDVRKYKSATMRGSQRTIASLTTHLVDIAETQECLLLTAKTTKDQLVHLRTLAQLSSVSSVANALANSENAAATSTKISYILARVTSSHHHERRVLDVHHGMPSRTTQPEIIGCAAWFMGNVVRAGGAKCPMMAAVSSHDQRNGMPVVVRLARTVLSNDGTSVDPFTDVSIARIAWGVGGLMIANTACARDLAGDEYLVRSLVREVVSSSSTVLRAAFTHILAALGSSGLYLPLEVAGLFDDTEDEEREKTSSLRARGLKMALLYSILGRWKSGNLADKAICALGVINAQPTSPDDIHHPLHILAEADDIRGVSAAVDLGEDTTTTCTQFPALTPLAVAIAASCDDAICDLLR